MLAGVAALATGAAPSFAAYGDSANVFGKVTNKSGEQTPPLARERVAGANARPQGRGQGPATARRDAVCVAHRWRGVARRAQRGVAWRRGAAALRGPCWRQPARPLQPGGARSLAAAQR
jgi:hypothetical protein